MGLRSDSAWESDPLRRPGSACWSLCPSYPTPAEWHAALDETQQKRSLEIYLQVNGPVALTDEPIAKALAITDEQKGKLETALNESRAKSREAFQDFQSLSDEERAKKSEEITKARDESLLAVLTDEQKKQFEEMHGAKLEVDLSKLPRQGGR